MKIVCKQNELNAAINIVLKAVSSKTTMAILECIFIEAKEGKIKYQDEVLTYGGTDTSVMQYTGRGARVGAISIPSAFIHTGVEMIDMTDVKEALKLTVALCNKL